MASRSGIVAAAGILCVFACLTSVMALTEEQIALVKQLHDMCVAQTGADEAVIDACRTGTFAEDPKLKCYFKCTYEQIAVIDDDGVIDGDAMIAMLPEEMQKVGPPTIRKCQSITGVDACDAAFQFSKCLYTTDPPNFMMI